MMPPSLAPFAGGEPVSLAVKQLCHLHECGKGQGRGCAHKISSLVVGQLTLS